jgi:hypothetical protein
MTRVLMFDLGMTLLDADDRPFPHVTDVLSALASRPVKSCLVSDFDMALTPAVALRRYVAILDAAGLRPFFEPVSKRVTLSNHAGVSKPNRKIFEKALQRLGASSVPFSECLFVTENADHIEAVRSRLRMQVLHFGVDFTDWATFPDLLQSRPVLVPMSVPGHEDLGTLLVEVPEEAPEQVEEARAYVASLAAHNRIAGRPDKPAFQATHEIVTDERGNRRLVRTGFSAVRK